jgi:acyl-coenzyme A synthetase/AMP-(fatty) acid ligase
MDFVSAALARHATERPSELAAVDARHRLDWSTLRSLVEQAAESLRQSGVGPGAAVAVAGPDSVATLVAALAVIRSGGIHAPVDAAHGLDAARAQADHMGAPWWLPVQASHAPGVVSIERTRHPLRPDPLEAAGERCLFMRYSSGTTGAAKGVVLSERTLHQRIHAANAGLGLQAGDRMLWMLPMAYHFAVSILLYVEFGVGVVLGAALRASKTATIARDHAITACYCSPYHVARLAELPEQHSLPADLRQIVCTTAGLDAAIADACRRRHACAVRQALGIIEVGLPLISPGLPGEAAGDLGPGLPAYEILICDDGGGAVADGISGELCLRGPGLVDAYGQPWRSQDEILRDGFFHTGDRARRDERGHIRLLGRLKDVINVGGVKVFPFEVESVLSSHPAVAQVRVRPMPDARTGEAVLAEVVLRPQASDASLAELTTLCAERLPPLSRPARLDQVEALPVTGSGKVRRYDS